MKITNFVALACVSALITVSATAHAFMGQGKKVVELKIQNYTWERGDFLVAICDHKHFDPKLRNIRNANFWKHTRIRPRETKTIRFYVSKNGEYNIWGFIDKNHNFHVDPKQDIYAFANFDPTIRQGNFIPSFEESAFEVNDSHENQPQTVSLVLRD